jgi:hypothetical protein
MPSTQEGKKKWKTKEAKTGVHYWRLERNAGSGPPPPKRPNGSMTRDRAATQRAEGGRVSAGLKEDGWAGFSEKFLPQE